MASKNVKNVKAAEETLTSNTSILGTWEGKACDTKVVNNNGMFLNDELFDNILKSDEYKNGIKNRWYFTYLGHPDEVDAGKDDKDVVGLLKDVRKEANGDIWASIDLIATPLGKIVKTLIDAGVKFGVSIRGAGDVASNGDVDPESFVFRGFDIVRFPAYEDCIPVFQEIAASTDPVKQKNYKTICAAIKANANKIQSAEAIDMIIQDFNPVSDEYKILEDRKNELIAENCDECDTSECDDKDMLIEVLQQKLAAMTNLYLEQFNNNKCLTEDNNQLLIENSTMLKNNNRRYQSFQRIMSSQTDKLSKELDKVEKKLQTVTAANNRLKDTMHDKVVANNQLVAANNKLKAENRELITANTNLKSLNSRLDSRLNNEKRNNLIYKQKIDANKQLIDKKDNTISDLNAKYETVVASKDTSKQKVSDLEAQVESLNQTIAANEQIISEYQQAYADICAATVNAHLSNIPVTASTTVQELQDYIYSSTGTSSISAKPEVEEMEDISIVDPSDSQGIVTL